LRSYCYETVYVERNCTPNINDFSAESVTKCHYQLSIIKRKFTSLSRKTSIQWRIVQMLPSTADISLHVLRSFSSTDLLMRQLLRHVCDAGRYTRHSSGAC
jgi:hypothetical protein